MIKSYLFKGLTFLQLLLPLIGQIQTYGENLYNVDTLRSNFFLISNSLLPDSTFQDGFSSLKASGFRSLFQKRIAVVCNQDSRIPTGHILDAITSCDSIFLEYLIYGIREREKRGDNFLIGGKDFKFKGLGKLFLWNNETRLEKEIDPERVDLFLVDLPLLGLASDEHLRLLLQTLAYADRYEKTVIICDRPDPLRGDIVEAPLIQINGYKPLPLRYGLTTGELIWYLLDGQESRAKIMVYSLHGYKREKFYRLSGDKTAGQKGEQTLIVLMALKEVLKGFNITMEFLNDSTLLIYENAFAEPELCRILNKNLANEFKISVSMSLEKQEGELIQNYRGLEVQALSPGKVRITTTVLKFLNIIRHLYPGKNLVKSLEQIKANFPDPEFFLRLKYRLDLNALYPLWDSRLKDIYEYRREHLFYQKAEKKF